MDHVTLLRELVAIDSVNPELVPGGRGEQEIGGFVAMWLGDRGLGVVTDEAAPGRPNVIGTVRGRGNGRSLMINAHMDTVGTGRWPTRSCPESKGADCMAAALTT